MIKNLRLLPLLLFVIAVPLLFYFPTETVAAPTGDCADWSVTPDPPSVDSNTPVVFTATGCTSSEYTVQIYRASEACTPQSSSCNSSPVSASNVSTDAAGNLTVTVAGLPEQISYQVQIWYRADLIDPVGQPVILQNIDITAVSAAQCGGIVPNQTAVCPNECGGPPVLNTNGNIWYCPCGGANAACCTVPNPAGIQTNAEGCLLQGSTCGGGTCTTPFTQTYACGTAGNAGIETAIGCIPITNLNNFSAFFLRWGLGISGGVATIMLIYSSFLIMTSSGEPRRLETGKELLFSTISGIILMTFCVFVLRIIGINVLGIF